MHWTQVFVALTLAVYLGAFVFALAAVRRSTGESSLGQAQGHPLEKLAGVVASVVLLVTGIAYAVDRDSVNWFGRIHWLDGATVRGIGVSACVLAGVLLIWGEVSLGRALRVALPDRSEPLVTNGIYRWMRNPLALSVDLLSLGLLCVAPSWLAAAGFALSVVAYDLKIRVEERYLREAHGTTYAAYCARTGRYLPRLINREVTQRNPQ